MAPAPRGAFPARGASLPLRPAAPPGPTTCLQTKRWTPQCAHEVLWPWQAHGAGQGIRRRR